MKKNSKTNFINISSEKIKEINYHLLKYGLIETIKTFKIKPNLIKKIINAKENSEINV